MSKLRHETMITIREASEMMKSYPKRILRLIEGGAFPGAYKVSTYKTAPYLIPLDEVESYIAKQKAEKKRGAATK